MVHAGLDGRCVVRYTVTFCAARLDAEEGGGGVGFVLRLGAFENHAGRSGEGGGLVGRCQGVLDTLAGFVNVEVALSPGVDNCIAGEDRVTRCTLNSDRAGGEVDIVDYKSAARIGNAVGVEDGLDADGSVGECAVLENDRADRLIVTASGSHVNAYPTVVDGDRLERPYPVPVHVDSGVAAIEGQVASCELLVAEEGTIVATIECEVRHETARAIVHEYSLLLVVAATTLNHVEDDVLKTGSLSYLPVNTRSSGHR